MISFRGIRKLSSYLVRAKVYPLERFVGSFKCGSKRCQVCLNLNETDCFKSSVTNIEYKINHQLNCIDKCLIYLLTCHKCKKQYVGKTCDRFRLHWNNYKDNDTKFLKEEICIQQHLFEHFSGDGHSNFLDDVSITFIDKTDPKDRCEHYWRHTLRTMAPDGLNIEMIKLFFLVNTRCLYGIWPLVLGLFFLLDNGILYSHRDSILLYCYYYFH